MTEIPTESGKKLYLATVIDLYSRRLLGAAMGLHPDADLACAAINMAVAARGGRQAIWREQESERVIFHTDRGSTGGFNWSSQHLDDGGVVWPSAGKRKSSVGGVSGQLIVRCGRQCGHRVDRSRRVRCSASSGG